MRDRKGIQAGIALALEIGPQVLGTIGIKGRKRRPGAFRVAEKNIAMEVLVDRYRGPLKGNQGGELAWLVVLVCYLHMFLPARLEHLGIVEHRVGVVGGQAHGDFGEGLITLLGVTGKDQFDDLIVLVLGHQFGLRVRELRHDAKIFRVVSHRTPVVGRLFLHHLAGGVLLDLLALTEVVSIVGGIAGTHCVSVRRVLRVQVLLTKIHVVQWIGLAGITARLAWRSSGGACDQHRTEACCQLESAPSVSILTLLSI